MKIILFVASAFFTSLSFAADVKEFDGKDLTEILVDDPAGKVVISGIDGDKAKVVVTKVKFTDKCKVVTEKVGPKLTLKIEKTGIFFGEDCMVNFDVAVPKSIDVEVVIGSGKLIAEGTQGSLKFKMGSGSVVANGTFKNVEGKSGSGSVKIKGLTGGGDIKTGSGAIDLTFATPPKGEIELATGSGDTTLLFPKGSKVKTTFKSGSGKATNTLGDNPNGDFHVNLKVGSGNLKISPY